MSDYSELKRLAEACPNTDHLQLVDYHGTWHLRNAGGILLTVRRDKLFPNDMAQNESYARLAEAANPAAVLALLAENERLKALLECAQGDFRTECRMHDKLKAEVEGLRKDAERYKWMRSQLNITQGAEFDREFDEARAAMAKERAE